MKPTSASRWRLAGARAVLAVPGMPADACIDIGVENGRIAAIHAAGSVAPDPAEPVFDARGLLVMPGLVNAHAHSNEQFEQGAYDGDVLEPWLAQAYPPLGTGPVPARWHYLRTLLFGLQSLRSGVAAVHDDFLNPGCDAEALACVVQAYEDIGLRARIALTLGDRGYLDGMPLAEAALDPALAAALRSREGVPRAAQLSYADTWLRARRGPDSRVGFSLGPRGPQRCTPALMQAVAELARRYAAPVQMHVLETRAQWLAAQRQYGRSFVQVLDDCGLLGPALTLNHAIWLQAQDIAQIAARGARVAHNPLSNFKLASGLCPVKALRRAGVEVALGTDGAASGDSVDFFDTLRMAALVHKLDASETLPAPDARDVLDMATRAGAASMGGAGVHGELRVGQAADLTLIDLNDPALVPCNDPANQLCYAATSRAVHTVVVAGEVVYTAGRCVRIDEAALRDEIAAAAGEFRARRQARSADAALLDGLRLMARRARDASAHARTLNRIRLP